MKAGNGQKEDRLCTRREAAERLHVCVRTVARLEKAGTLRPVPGISPRLIFFRNSDIEKLIAGEAG